MREKLIESLIKEVYGPRNGAEEEMSEYPVQEYTSGVIIPYGCKGKAQDPDSESVEYMGEDALADDENSQETSPPFFFSGVDPSLRAKSFGMAFQIDSGEPKFKVCITWGRYSYIKEKKIWKRKPYRKILDIVMTKERDVKTIYSDKDGEIILYIQKKVHGSQHSTIMMHIVNKLEIDAEKCGNRNLSEKSLFQPSMRVIVEGQLKPMDKKVLSGPDSLLYRSRPVLARGFMSSAVWKNVDYMSHLDKKILWPDGLYFKDCSEFIECDVRSEFIPLYSNPSPSFGWDEEFGQSPEFSAYLLSEMWDEEEIKTYLSLLIEAYEKWIKEKEKEASLLSDDLGKIANDIIIKNQKKMLERIKNGIEILKKDEMARLSFCFANRAIFLQKKWNIEKKSETRDDKDVFKWWPFQIAFFLMSIEALVNENSEDRDVVDLLWIPTGGGKTEAYLAIMAFIMAYRRIKSRKLGNVSQEGVSIITRYTLRLLTVQQFRRALRMVTAAEYLRVMKTEYGRGWRPKKYTNKEDWIYGTVRFSTGMWVGGGVSPNHLRKSGYAIDALKGNKNHYGEPAQILRCPVCDSWLAIPESGLPAGENTLHIVVKSPKTLSEVDSALKSVVPTLDVVEDITVTGKNHPDGYLTLTIKFKSKKNIKSEYVDGILEHINNMLPSLRLEGISFRESRPGYFPVMLSEKIIDFDIYCPSPECKLNSNIEYMEGVPAETDEGALAFPDSYVPKSNESFPFKNSRMPIPAYTVDEQIYHHLPTLLVSTADKIARLAFEPRAGTIFGNVDAFNTYFGYHRKGLTPEGYLKRIPQRDVNIGPISPPDLIVQDELHLMEGPLGSMFGLYESVVEELIKDGGGKPKYIVSTATTRNTEKQINRLFSRKVFQFPPDGLNINDSFFVRAPSYEKGWDEKVRGQIYMGIFCPGRGPLTPQIRIWSELLKTTSENISDPDIKFFWTIVGYFNAIRELGGGRALYREDVVERLKDISNALPREMFSDKLVELSSRVNSTDIPQILESLEKAVDRNVKDMPDAILTTSMFGTGVDIPHLSLMIVNGQPKTTSQYIQATGRVGRSHGALVITFYRAGRPRDESHYEMFMGYHHRIHLDVEPSSVSPFSDGCLSRAAGPAIVSFLRNMRKSSVEWWRENNGRAIIDGMATNDTQRILSSLKSKTEDIYGLDKTEEIQGLVDRWKGIARMVPELHFYEYTHPKSRKTPEKNVVLGDPAHEHLSLKVVFKNSPQSLRDIEETIGFGV